MRTAPSHWMRIGRSPRPPIYSGDLEPTRMPLRSVMRALSERSYGRIPHLVPVENIGTGDFCCVRHIPGTLHDSPVILSPLDSSEADYMEDREGFAHWLIEKVRNN